MIFNKPFITVLGDGAPVQFHKGLMWSYNREQRASKEYGVRKFMRVQPLYRINIKPRRPVTPA